jgi:outer membrane receptor protein involved in Fe transport
MNTYLQRFGAVLAAILMLGSVAQVASAQETGKIKGTVTNSETGEPLPGANVRVKGTMRGAVTGAEGVYNVLQVPVGTHDLVVSFVGFNQTTVQDVRVKSGLTAQVDVELTPEDVQMGEVTVEAEQNMVQQDITHTQDSYDREELAAAPGVTSSMDVFRAQGGAFQGGPDVPLSVGGQQVDAREGKLQNIHLRGGRGGDILYLVDGLPITHPIYGGRSVLDLDLSTIERIEVVKGAYGAEYGNSQSGVVKIWTRSGRDEYQGGFRYQTDTGLGFLGETFGRQHGSFYFSGLEPITAKLLPALGIDFLKNDFTFFLNANTNLTNTRVNNHRPRETYSVAGLFDVTGKQDNTLGASAKLTYQPNPRFRAVLNYNGSWRQWSPFGWRWVGRPFPEDATPAERSLAEHQASAQRSVGNGSFRIRHTLSDATYYNLRLGYQSTDFERNLNGLRPQDFWFMGPDTTEGRGDFDEVPYRRAIDGTSNNPVTGFRSDFAFESPWRFNKTRRYTVDFDLNSQIHPDHLIKTGFNAQFMNLDYIDIQGGGFQLSNYGRFVTGRLDSLRDEEGEFTRNPDPPPGPHKLFAQNRWVFNSHPAKGAFFLTDKFEKYSLIINAGLRLDWFRPGDHVFKDQFANEWCEATGLVEGSVITEFQGTEEITRSIQDPVCTIQNGSVEEFQNGEIEDPQFKTDWARYRYAFSPRLGVSFPIFERTQIYFSYGHFAQLPELQYFYRDPYTNRWAGNPGLEYVNTIKYEFGLTHQFARTWAFDVKTFNRDITDQVGLTRVGPPDRRSVSVWDNKAYASARGFEFKLRNRSRLRSNLSGEATYTLQWAKGYSSSAFDDYRRQENDFPDPIRPTRLGWDRRHDFVLRGTLKSPDQNPLDLFGLTFPTDWRITVLTNLSSGPPYTPGTTDPRLRQLRRNAAEGPPQFRTDVRFRKRFDVAGGKAGFFIEANNLFDQRNVTVRCGGAGTCAWFNQWTGKPFAYGDVNQPSPVLYDFYRSYRVRTPRQFQLGRRVQLGLRYDF